MKYIEVTSTPNKPFVFEEAGRYMIFFHNVPGEYEVDMRVPGVQVEIYGLFEGKGADNFQLKTTQLHSAPKTTSNLFIKGVFEDRSSFTYSGLIRIQKNCNGAHAYQKNQNLLLSAQASVHSEPNLEILSHDVFCTHGSTTGTVNEEQVHYLQTRGIDRKNATHLLTTGFIQDLLDKLPTGS